VRCPLIALKRTFIDAHTKSALCQKRTRRHASSASWDGHHPHHLIRGRDRELNWQRAEQDGRRRWRCQCKGRARGSRL